MSDIYPIAVPKWGIEMVEGTISSWNKAVGDAVSKNDDIFEMESDKIVNVWESPTDGVLRRQLVPEGETKAVGTLLGIIAGADVSDADIDAFIADFAGPAAAPAAAAAAPAAARLFFSRRSVLTAGPLVGPRQRRRRRRRRREKNTCGCWR